MKFAIAYLGAFLPTLGGILTYKFPESPKEWLTALVVSLGAGFAGNGARGVNARIKQRP